MSGAPYYRLCKDIKKIECLTCGRKLSGMNMNNLGRHYRLVHRIDIVSFIKRGRKKKKKSNDIRENEESSVLTINMQNEEYSENHDEDEAEDAEMQNNEEKPFDMVHIQKEEDISDNINQESTIAHTFLGNKINEFIKHYDLKKTECLRCGKFLSGVSNSNLKRHFRLIHNENLAVGNKLFFAVPKDNETNDSMESMAKRPKLSKRMFFGNTAPIDKNKFLKCCVGLVAIKGVSLSIFDDNDFFKKLIAPQEEKFGTNLNSKDILSLIEHSSLKIRNIITRKVNNKFVSLKLDIVTGIYHNVLGINIQYIDDFKIHCCTLDIMQVDHSDILKDIKNNVLKCLENYQIDKDQVYCCTVHIVNNIEKWNNTMQNLNEDQICVEMAEFEANISASNLIHSTANDVLKDLKPKLINYRNIVEKLWTASPGYRDCLPLDNESDWLSTYEMLKSLLEIRCCLEEEEVAEHLASQPDWAFITDITSALAPLVNLINKLDNEQYVVGDFYRDWLSCEIELEELLSKSKFARLFVQTMQTYIKKLLKSNAFSTALYLDPRFNFCNSVMLTEEQKSKAEAFLKKTYKTMSSSKKNLSQTTPETPGEVGLHAIKCEVGLNAIKCEEEPNTSKKAYDKLAQRIMNMSANKSESEEPQRSFMQKLIGLLSNKTMAPLDTDVLQYWKAMSFDAEIIAMLQAALTVPVTQVTVGRATNALVNSKEYAINYNLLLTKYNFHEINEPAVELELPEELLVEMSFEN